MNGSEARRPDPLIWAFCFQSLLLPAVVLLSLLWVRSEARRTANANANAIARQSGLRPQPWNQIATEQWDKEARCYKEALCQLGNEVVRVGLIADESLELAERALALAEARQPPTEEELAKARQEFDRLQRELEARDKPVGPQFGRGCPMNGEVSVGD